VDEHEVREAVAVANVPALLMVLVQLTGERRWLEPPYRPVRAQGMSDNDTGGLPEAIQGEIRDAALEAIEAWRAGRPVAVPDPSPELLVEMLSVAMGEPVPPEYGPMIAAQLRLAPPEVAPIPVPEGFRVLVIGAGVSGLCAAVNLQAAGIAFTVVEKHHAVGGTWLQNRYPGAGVDTPNHLYSFSFCGCDWRRYFALRDELWAYLEHVADTFDLRRHVRFSTEVVRCRYDADAQAWDVELRGPDGAVTTERAHVVISATGIFNPMKLPDIPGLGTFAGPAFHTAAWPDDVELAGRRVAIIGNGASCMQVAPEIQPDVASLTIFQRSPQWAAPFEQFRKEVPPPVRSLLAEVPLYRAWYRVRLGWTFNDRIHPTLQKDPGWAHPDRSLNAHNDAHREYFTRYLVAELGDRTDLLPKVLPTYPPFGKRMLMDNGWFRTLTEPNVELVTEPIREIVPEGVLTADGHRHDADVLVLATGFDVLRFLTSYEAIGRDGRTLREVWDDDDARAYLGTAVPGFPNFFVLYGPNTQPGHGGSLIFVVEMQVHYVMDVLRQMAERGLGAVEVRADVHDAYNDGVDRAHDRMVWTHPGMETYYRNARGRVVVNFPYRNVDLFRLTRHADLDDYVTEPSVAGAVGAGPRGRPR
jgi:4-hydroxyacetophenone monooxygenase